MFYFTLCGVKVRRFRKPKKSVRGAIVALDVKITDFQDRITDNRYRSSKEALVEISQIIGEIKFMYLSGLLNASEYRRVVSRLTGQNFEDDDYNENEED